MSVCDPMTILAYDEAKDDWVEYAKTRSLSVNKNLSDIQSAAGGERSSVALNFKVRWTSYIGAMEFDMQKYRLLYRGHRYKLEDYDDYQQQHRTVKLVGVLDGID